MPDGPGENQRKRLEPVAEITRYLSQLPIIPDVASKVLEMANHTSDVSFQDLEEVIMVDPALVSKILKVANSALFARQREITTLQMAIGMLGLNNIRSLVLLVTASQFSGRLKNHALFQDFWKHSIVTAFIARTISVRVGSKSEQETAFLGGLMHDIGQVGLLQHDPDAYRETVERRAPEEDLAAAEQRSYGTDHKQLGAAILDNWNFPALFIDTAREHGNPTITSQHKRFIAQISVADSISMRIGYHGAGRDGFDKDLDLFRTFTPLTERDMAYLLEEYPETLVRDPLFQECRQLFGTEQHGVGRR